MNNQKLHPLMLQTQQSLPSLSQKGVNHLRPTEKPFWRHYPLQGQCLLSILTQESQMEFLVDHPDPPKANLISPLSRPTKAAEFLHRPQQLKNIRCFLLSQKYLLARVASPRHETSVFCPCQGSNFTMALNQAFWLMESLLDLITEVKYI